MSVIVDMFPGSVIAKDAENDERYTLRETDAWCRKVAGVEQWDLDAAACDESHLAPKFYTKADDGLTKPWFGNVWCNPPFSDIGSWVAAAWAEMVLTGSKTNLVAMLLPASRTEQGWWQQQVEPYRDEGVRSGGRHVGPVALMNVRLTTHFLPGRTRFGHPGNPEGVGVGSPPFGCVLLVWRRL